MKKKNTAYFYIALSIVVIVIAFFVYSIIKNEQSVASFISQGYTEEEVREYYSIATLMNSIMPIVSPFAIIAAIFFCANSFLNQMIDIQKNLFGNSQESKESFQPIQEIITEEQKDIFGSENSVDISDDNSELDS